MKAQILATLAYADIFDYPLTEEEIWEWLINLKTENGKQKTDYRRQKTEDREEFAHSLQLALHSHSIRMSQGCYCLPGREEIIKIRQEKERWSVSKFKRAEKVAGILRLIPWIKLVGVTGGLARMNADKGDDIDLFFITAKNRLWLTRGLVVLVLSLLGLYRRKNKIANMICPNMFVSEDCLQMKPEDVYMAHEVCLMKPIFIRGDTYQRFLRINSWIKNFLPNALDSKNQKSKIKNTDQISKLFSLLILICNFTFYILNFTFIEKISRFFQIWYMRQRRTTEVVSDNLIKFHPQDVRQEILTKWQERRESYR
ncbi:MAG: hypothetical protein Q8Q15_02480 [bacterium]|nr:hypothetical protein [bacterium]